MLLTAEPLARRPPTCNAGPWISPSRTQTYLPRRGYQTSVSRCVVSLDHPLSGISPPFGDITPFRG